MKNPIITHIGDIPRQCAKCVSPPTDFMVIVVQDEYGTAMVKFYCREHFRPAMESYLIRGDDND